MLQLGSNYQIFLISIKNSLFNVETGDVHKVREMGKKETHNFMGVPMFQDVQAPCRDSLSATTPARVQNAPTWLLQTRKWGQSFAAPLRKADA